MNSHQHISGLPVLPWVSERPSTFELCNLLALMLSEMKYRGFVVRAQRSYAEGSNRVRSGSISQKRRKLEAEGWVKRIRRTQGLVPDVYQKGSRLLGSASLDRKWNEISKALYGKNGLLSDTLGSPGWGHQCLNPGAILTIAALKNAKEELTIPKIVNYFSPLCSESTVRNGIKKLKKLGIVRDVSGVLVLSEDWSVVQGRYFLENPCCLDRSIRNQKIRAVERESLRLQITSGALNSDEKSRLRSLPCVRCGGKSSQQEHFPPKRFLKGLSNQNGRHVVWAICRKCNMSTQKYIQSMPLLHPQKTIFFLSSKVDPWRIYRARANMQLLIWYEAIEKNDDATAVDAAQKTLNLYAALLNHDSELFPWQAYHAPIRRLRRQIGRTHASKRKTSSSQLLD